MSYLGSDEVILGLDMSLSGTGVTVMNCKTGKPIHFELISSEKMKTKAHKDQTKLTIYDQNYEVKFQDFIPSSNLLDMRRIAFFKERIEKLIEDFHVTRIIIEGYSYGSTGRSTLTLAELGAVIRFMIYSKNLKYVQCPPMVAKAYMTGISFAPKEKIQEAIFEKFKFKIEDDNINDSFMMAQMYLDFGDKIEDFLKEGSVDLLKERKAAEFRLKNKNKVQAFKKILEIGLVNEEDVKKALAELADKNLSEQALALGLKEEDLAKYLEKKKVKIFFDLYRLKKPKKEKKKK